MKRRLSILLMIALLVGLTACGSKKEGSSAGSSGSESSSGSASSSVSGSSSGSASSSVSGNSSDSGSGEKVDIGELTTLDLGYMTVGYPAGAELEDDWIWGQMIKDKNGRYSFNFTAEQNLNNINATREEWVFANQNSTSNFTEFKQEIGGMTDVFCVKFNDVASGPTAHYSVAFPETADGVAGVKIRINSKADGLKIDDVLALPEVQAILESIRF